MLQIGSVVWGVRDLPRAISFWTAALNYRLRNEPDNDWAVLVPREGVGVQLALKVSTLHFSCREIARTCKAAQQSA